MSVEHLFEVTAVVQGTRRHKVLAGDEDGAIAAVRDAGPGTLSDGPVEGQTVVGIVGVDPLPDPGPVDHDRLARDGVLALSRIGYREYDHGGRRYASTWVSGPGTPRWAVAEVPPGGG